MSHSVNIKYQGPVPGVDDSTYVLFATASPSAGVPGAFPGANYLAMHALKRLQLSLFVPASGTLNWYASQTRRDAPNVQPVWVQLGTLAVTGSGTSATTLDLLVEEYSDVKLEFVNGGTAQTGMQVDMALSSERNKGT